MVAVAAAAAAAARIPRDTIGTPLSYSERPVEDQEPARGDCEGRFIVDDKPTLPYKG